MRATPTTFNRTVQLIEATGLLLVFSLLIWHAGHAGYASLLSVYAGQANRIAAADAAVSSAPGDPEVHYVRAAVLEANNDLTGAIAEYDKAASLRPDDYVLWFSLARARELNRDVPGALTAARQAIQLAPFYAQSHWQLGNLLVRAGQRDEGFEELRLAGARNPLLLPGIVDLAWQLSGGDVEFLKQAIQPQTPEAYNAVAENLSKHGKIEDAISMFIAAGDGEESIRLREQYLNELISARRFKEAYVLWSQRRPANPNGGLGVIIDPGFEQESNLDEPGFGWRTENKAPSLSLSLDTSNPKQGHSSLKVDFNGDSDPAAPIISQLVLVEPGVRYRLRFSLRTEGLISGGLPNLSVIDANDNSVLGQSDDFPPDSGGWRDYSIDFNSRESTTAIQVRLQRKACSKGPCPIFGRLWLDGFWLHRS